VDDLSKEKIICMVQDEEVTRVIHFKTCLVDKVTPIINPSTA
jgi:hypothetical protein